MVTRGQTSRLSLGRRRRMHLRRSALTPSDLRGVGTNWEAVIANHKEVLGAQSTSVFDGMDSESERDRAYERLEKAFGKGFTLTRVYVLRSGKTTETLPENKDGVHYGVEIGRKE